MWHLDEHNNCVHKDLFPPNINDLTMTILIFIASLFTTIAGIGGGGLLIPIYMMIGQFGTEDTIPLTVITIAGSSLIRMIILFNKRHLNQTVKRYLIDYGAIFLIVPFDGNTAFIGLILNTICPNWLILISVFVILSITTVKTFLKAKRLYKSEKRRSPRSSNTVEMGNQSPENIFCVDGISFTVEQEDNVISVDGIDIKIEEEEMQELTEHVGDKSVHRFKNLGIVSLAFTIFTLFTILREKANEKCSVTYWITYCAQFIVLTLIGISLMFYNVKKYHKRTNKNYKFIAGDVHWSFKVAMKFAVFASITGIVSTYLGIGGGMLIGPFLLSTGMTPITVAATDSVTTFFSSTASSIQYIVAGRIMPYYSVYFFVISAIASNIGLKASTFIVKKVQKQSIIVIILGLLIFTSTVLLLVTGLVDGNFHSGFKDFCSSANQGNH